MTTPSYQIEKLVHGGLGLSHDQDGKTILIAGALPGESVEAVLSAKGKDLQQGALSKILTGSPERIQPPCPLSNQCGGCDFQHMTYPCQLQMKEAIVKDLLTRTGHPALRQAAETLLLPPLPSPEQFHYRQRIRLQVDKNQTVGFHGQRSHNCVAVTSCLLARREINCCLQELLPHRSFKKLLANTESLEILFNPDSSGIILLFHFTRKPRPGDEKESRVLLQDLTEVENIFFIGDTFALSGTVPNTEEEVPASLAFSLPPLPPHTPRPLQLSWEVGGFCQVNLEQNINLITTVLTWCQAEKEDTFLDLFCGMGNFSIPLAEQAGSVLGIEGQGSAIRSARTNSARAGQINTEFRKRPIHQACDDLLRDNRQFDCVVADPPRQGLPGLARQLSHLCRERLVYISCDPATLCRDLKELIGQGFTLTRLQPIDMFPQTHHIETVALLKKA